MNWKEKIKGTAWKAESQKQKGIEYFVQRFGDEYGFLIYDTVPAESIAMDKESGKRCTFEAAKQSCEMYESGLKDG